MPCFMRAFALKVVYNSIYTFLSIMLLAAFVTSCVSFAVDCMMSIITVVKALCNLILRCEFFRCMRNIIDVEVVCNTFVCSI